MEGIKEKPVSQGGYGTPVDLGMGAWACIVLFFIMFIVLVLIPALKMGRRSS